MPSAIPVTPVILSGGAGTRLWPMSRALHPKQLLPLLSEKTLLQETLERVGDLPGEGERRFAPPLVIANDEHRFIVAEQLRRAGAAPEAIILEPVGRSTAPAACVAALHLTERNPDAIMLVLPSDQTISDTAAFHSAIDRALPAAAKGTLVTFGITPLRADTGYGYIRRGAPIDGAPGCHAVAAFVEKPERERAEAYLNSGDYFWNGGIFLFPAALYLQELARTRPEIVEACRAAIAASRRDLDFLRLSPASFGAQPSDSIDYAVMERTDRAAVVPVEMGWSDVGSWEALREAGGKDADGNVLLGDILAEDVTNSYLRSDGKLIAALGLDGMAVVATPDAVLVAPLQRSQEVKRLVARLEREGRGEATIPAIVHRPWGTYRAIHEGPRVQVKHIVVLPGGRLSLQMHHHRAEHWVVVQGTARIRRGEEEMILHEDQSTYIPVGTPHRLENPGKIPLHLIEVQSGSYLGEDDIVRFEDNYGRG